MIKDVANEILSLVKSNSGLDKSEIYDKPNIELQKIVDIISSECRCSIVDSKGNYIRFGSSTDIRIIKNLVKIFISNLKEISPEIVSMALMKEEIFGPFMKIGFEKKYNSEKDVYEIDIEQVFPQEFYTSIFEKNLEVRAEFINEVVKPYVKQVIFEDDVLMTKSPIGAFISKKTSTLKQNDELVNSLEIILKKVLKCDKSLISNIANYIVINIMNNKYFKRELINKTLETTQLQQLGKIYTGFNSLVESMVSETIRMIELRSFPYGEYISIKNTYFTAMAVLEGLNTNLENMSEIEIFDKIKQINRFFAITDRGYKDNNMQFRNENVSCCKYGESIEVVDSNFISTAMENLCKMIKVLLQNKENIDVESYVKEVMRIHYRFLRIQPFGKANGRTARTVVNMLLQSKEMVGIFRKEKRKEYVNYIEQANIVINRLEEKYLDGLVNNPMSCVELENEFLNVELPFLLVKN